MFKFFIYVLVSLQLISGTVGVQDNVSVNVTESIEQKKVLSDEEILKIKPNELGEIMVIMYHNLVDDPKREGYYARTPDNLRKDLQRLWEEDYIPVSMSDFVSGRIDIPAGKTPVIFTFDDGHITNFNVLEDGSIDPNCVIGIFEAFHKEHPDFVPRATFYLNNNIFFGNHHSEFKLKYLIDNGYELANHTATHANLKKISKDKVKDEILTQAIALESMTGNKAFHFSVPFGEKPKAYFEWLKDTSWLEGYQMLSSVNVGWNPVVSPYHKDFNPLSINRITVGEDEAELYYWMDILKENPKRRYYSDGNVDTITVPKSAYKNLNDSFIKEHKIAVYDESGVEWK